MYTGYSKRSTYHVTPVCFLAVRSRLGAAEDVEAIGLVSCMAADLSSSLSDPVLSAKCKVILSKIKQMSCLWT